MAFESGGVPEGWSSAVILPLYKDKGERNEYRNYRGISLLNVVGKIYVGILSPWLFIVYMDEGGEGGDGSGGSEIPEGWEKVEITRPLVCRLLISVW